MTNTSNSAHIVADVMTDDLITVRVDDTVDNARDLVLSLGIHALPVMENESCVGMLTTADLSDDWPGTELVGAVMSSPVYRVSAEASLREAADAMVMNHVHHLVVESRGGTVGILSSFDLLRTLSAS